MNIEMTATLIVPLLIQENKQGYQFIGKPRCKKMEIMAGRHLPLRPSSCNPVIYLFHIRQRRPTKHTNQFDDGFKKDHYVQIRITSMPELLTLLKTQHWSNCMLNLVSTKKWPKWESILSCEQTISHLRSAEQYSESAPPSILKKQYSYKRLPPILYQNRI